MSSYSSKFEEFSLTDFEDEAGLRDDGRHLLALWSNLNYNVTTLKFDWDPLKAELNWKKHGVSFELASTVFDDPIHLSVPDPDHREARWVTIGLAVNTQMLVVVSTDRIGLAGEEIVRIISARKATRKERESYEEGI